MKPQTYNNFIGAQGSKPNVELIYGIVNRYGVNPMWLLNGNGAVFTDESKSAEYLGRSPAYRNQHAGQLAVTDQRAGFGPTDPAALEALRTEIRSAEPVLERAEGQLRQLEHSRLNVIDRCVALLRRAYELDAVSTVAELRDLLQRLERRLAETD